jgi:hypothetical protein
MSWELIVIFEKISEYKIEIQSLQKLIFLFLCLFITFFLASQNARLPIGFIGCVFATFSIYHIYNFEKPCGCLNRSGISTIEVVVVNGLLAALCFIYAMTQPLARSLWFKTAMAGSLSLLGIVLVMLVLNGNERTGKLNSLCDWQGKSQPIELAAETENAFNLDTEDFLVFVLNTDCKKCKEFAEKNFPESVLVELQSSQTAGQVVLCHLSDKVWNVLDLDNRNNRGESIVLPSQGKVVGGILESCVLID